PSVVLWQGRVRLAPALALRSPRSAAVIGGILLGLSLWPITLEIGAYLRAHGLTTIPPAILEKVRASLDRLREVPAVFAVLVLGVLGPLLEELFFRGLLFGAIERERGPGVAIGLTAVLFGVFHLFLPGAMALERVVTTAFMGLVLGWVRWQAGSVWPGGL